MEKYARVLGDVAAQHAPSLISQYGLLCGQLPFGSDTAVIYVSKPSWSNRFDDTRTHTIGIFFSLWLTPTLVGQEMLAYNIHALKLRELPGFTLTAINFASEFRTRVKGLVVQWPGLRMDYGPRTLLEGRVSCTIDCLAKSTTERLVDFVGIHHVIDELLEEHTKVG